MTMHQAAPLAAEEPARWVLLRPTSQADDDLVDFADADDADMLAMQPWSILIVDDDSEVHRAVELALMGVRVAARPLNLMHCLSAAEARKRLAERPGGIDLVLLDVVMETADAGLALLEDMRAAPATQSLPVLLHTGQPGQAPERLIRARYDISGYLPKTTVTRQGLIKALETILVDRQPID
ncbi:response regulator [Dongia rigui]|uniref:Response regulator n=1 Tax=Dongia rigui TaxID=940149 RepID=A0ABU5DU50_9PROT|nr:response regulator [Dongia rigui]MDY0870840.1 response regulator [Dongia rigui]